MRDDDSTLTLLGRARAGDAQALNALAVRFLPRLRRWASGRLPPWARDLSDTEDIIQDALLATLRALDRFEPRHEAALAVYLRQAVGTRVLNEIRRVRRRPATVPIDDDADGAAPRVPAASADRREAYERALGELSAEEREAIVGRIEMNYSYRELAEAWGKPTADAARKTVERAILRLAERLRR